MRQFRFIFIAILTSLFVINAVFWRKAIAVLLCGVVSFNSTSCYSFLSEYGKADAAVPSKSAAEVLNHSGIVQNEEKKVADNAGFNYSKDINNFGQQGQFDCPASPNGVCAAASIINSFIFLDKQYPKVYNDNNNLAPNYSKLFNTDKTDAEAFSEKWHVPGKPLRKGYYVRMLKNADGSKELTNTIEDWVNDHAPDTTVVQYWGYPEINNLREAMQSDGAVQLAIADYATQKSAHLINLTQISCDSVLRCNISFQDPNLPENTITRDLFGKVDTTSNKHSSAADNFKLSIYYSLDEPASGKNSQLWGIKDAYLEAPPAEASPALSPETPCNQPINQSKSDNKQDKNQCPIAANIWGDPHMTTFDGLKYDLQTLGEFTLVKSHRSNFEVQSRHIPYNSSGSLAISSAVAVKVGSDRVAIYAQELPDADTTTPLRVNGKPTTLQGDKLSLKGGGEILRQGGNYVMSAPTGEKVLVSSNGSYLNISPIVDNRAGKYSGLLGNVNGNPKDDLQTRSGKNVLEARSTYGDVKQVINLVGLRLPGVLDRAEQVYFDQLYKEFANSWRVKQEESLFDYPPGKATQSYVNPGFPDKYLTLNMLSADQIQKAQNTCTEAKVTPDLMEGCIFDVGFSGFSGFARTTAEISGYIGIVNQLIPGLNIPTPEQAVERVIEKVKPKVCLPFIGCV